MEYAIRTGDPEAPDVRALLAASDAYALALYPVEGVHMLDPGELAGPTVRFLVATSRGGMAEGCGAIVLRPDGSAEVKRMFVAPEARGNGLGSCLLRGLETLAREAGSRVIRLETGRRQPEAIRLYHRSGYRERGPFGAYHADAHSIFMEKSLEPELIDPPNGEPASI